MSFAFGTGNTLLFSNVYVGDCGTASNCESKLKTNNIKC
uniref:Uncharacterized protein n=1 Tax=Anguilla anguilla TaxID=7936 RepID=A0A0E9SFD3_ANGAN